MIQKQLWFEKANDYRTLHIYLPESYFNIHQEYPVMYFFDGHNLFFDEVATYGTCWGLKDFLDTWDKDLIVVGLECGHKKNERMNEYLPYTVSNGFLSEYTSLGKETWKWILEEVKPYIDSHYRTIPFRECTAIAGSSMGGLMSLYGLIHYNTYFSKAACVSSTIVPCIKQIEKDLKHIKLFEDTKVYLSWGTKEAFGILNESSLDTHSLTYKCNKKIYELLKDKSQMFCQIQGGHCEADWAKQVKGFMEYLWKNKDIQNVW